MDGVGGYAGWRWIFILEGLLTVIVSLFAPLAIHDSPETATFLTEEERRFVIHALRIQNSADRREMIQDEGEFRMKYVIDAFTDWQIYLGLFSKFDSEELDKMVLMSAKVYWGITCPLYGISLFLPSIIKDLGYKSSTAQLLTVGSPSMIFGTTANICIEVPIYITAAFVAVCAAWFSDRRKQRSLFILFFMSMIAIGFIICLASSGHSVPGVVYFGVFIAVIGKNSASHIKDEPKTN
jgi:Major Facilitator Superfamily.